MTDTLWAKNENCRAFAGREVHPDVVREYIEKWGRPSDDWTEVEATEEEAARFHAMGSSFGWRVARLIRSQLGTLPDDDEDEGRQARVYIVWVARVATASHGIHRESFDSRNEALDWIRKRQRETRDTGGLRWADVSRARISGDVGHEEESIIPGTCEDFFIPE